MRATQDQYSRLLKALLPPGAAWADDDEAVLNRFLRGVAGALTRAHNRGVDLTYEAQPASTKELLTEWERVAGLPDGCTATENLTQAERRDALVAKLAARGGQSIPFFIDLAAALGFEITITEHSPFQAGKSAAGQACNTELSRFIWTVHGPATTKRVFKAGISTAGEPLQKSSNTLLECAMHRLKPDHTLCNFTYGD